MLWLSFEHILVSPIGEWYIQLSKVIDLLVEEKFDKGVYQL